MNRKTILLALFIILDIIIAFSIFVSPASAHEVGGVVVATSTVYIPEFAGETVIFGHKNIQNQTCQASPIVVSPGYFKIDPGNTAIFPGFFSDGGSPACGSGVEGEAYLGIRDGNNGDPFIHYVKIYYSTTTQEITLNILFDDRTRFITTTPEYGTTTATTSQSVGFTAYINPDDSNLAANFHFTIDQPQLRQLACVLCAIGLLENPSTLINVDIPTFNGQGIYSYSTTTQFLSLGRYELKAYYEVPRFNLFGINIGMKKVVATSTWFIAGQKNAYDQVGDDFANHVADLLASTTASLADACSPFSIGFNMGDCLVRIVLPTADEWNANLTVLSYQAPWGYVRRFYDIVSTTTATTTMPTIAYTFGTTSSLIPSGTITLDPFGTLLEADSIVNAKSNQTEQKTLWEIMEPITYVIVYLMLFFMILRDLTGIGKHDITHKPK